ncbi:hypothetical protein QUH73_20645 [Labilibaculum sp. K2S]|uniref:hypothetical protein n=1 Tax=Labilibaculum sp. K2S TaxID=3056386 RepID=UPI0025A47E79|nr:hypothetical protein [Labilibaculum sp. K2S]MDM8162235.1 hypothetical protein [Labilibaculum sp. K2S]
MTVLFETKKLIIEHEFENAYLIEKSSGKELLFDDFHGDPKCGLISKKNDWAIIAGEHLTIWRADKRNNKQVERIENEELKWIHDVRLKSENIVEILTDPWSEKSAIWELDIETLEFIKIREFREYQDLEHTDTVKW